MTRCVTDRNGFLLRSRFIESGVTGMKLLFVHQNMPGQFLHLAQAFGRIPGNEVMFLTRRQGIRLPGVRSATYRLAREAKAETHHYLRLFESCVLHGQAVVRACLTLTRDGFVPDVIVAHPGWGEALFLRDVFRAPILSYCEFYYTAAGADVGFDPADPPAIDTICRLRARNAHLLLSLEACDRGVAPTAWQRSRHPAPFLPKIEQIHDGIDTTRIRPDPAARLELPDGTTFAAGEETVTYVARHLEPYRGFTTFMRALPRLLALRPNARVVIVGADGVSYGQPPKGGGSWRDAMLAEIGPLDPARVVFAGRLPYAQYLRMLQISAVHVYLTVPFVLSWSMLEAMAAGCLLVASATAPVTEVVTDGNDGSLVDFFDAPALATRIAEMLEARHLMDHMRAAARATVLERYALARCLPRQMALVRETAALRAAR
jgi:glycosyltransferase involved in cell wall biosynthesis